MGDQPQGLRRLTAGPVRVDDLGPVLRHQRQHDVAAQELRVGVGVVGRTDQAVEIAEQRRAAGDEAGVFVITGERQGAMPKRVDEGSVGGEVVLTGRRLRDLDHALMDEACRKVFLRREARGSDREAQRPAATAA